MKWEYKFFVIHVTPTGASLASFPGQLTQWPKIQEFGEQGWELVNCLPFGGTTGTNALGFIFKREKAYLYSSS
jgi:hypothetical protein